MTGRLAVLRAREWDISATVRIARLEDPGRVGDSVIDQCKVVIGQRQ